MDAPGHTVSAVARLAHVTVRTLHHYDELGLLVPSGRSPAGYRLYADADLARLREILLLRELGFALDAVANLLDQPPADRLTALRQQRERLVAQRQQTDAVIRAVDAALDAIEGDRPMTTETMFEGFEEFDHAAHEDEVQQRWGDTEAYRESKRRTRDYTKADWDRMKAEGARNLEAFAALLRAGDPPDGEAARAAAEEHRLHIDRWCYPCDHGMHVNLGQMYVADPRFTATYDQHLPGLAAFISAAISANAASARSPAR